MSENKETLKSSVLEDYKFYDRRYEQVSLLVAGFGLFGCLEFSKMLIEAQESLNNFVLFAASLFATSIVFSLFNLRIEKQIRAHYIGLFNEDVDTRNKSDSKSKSLENIGKVTSWINLIVTISAIILLILSAMEVHSILS